MHIMRKAPHIATKAHQIKTKAPHIMVLLPHDYTISLISLIDHMFIIISIGAKNKD